MQWTTYLEFLSEDSVTVNIFDGDRVRRGRVLGCSRISGIVIFLHDRREYALGHSGAPDVRKYAPLVGRRANEKGKLAIRSSCWTGTAESHS